MKTVTESLLGKFEINYQVGPKYIFLKTDKSIVKIELESIEYLEAKGDYVQFVGGEKKQLIKATMTEMKEKIPPHFLRVHRSYIINVDKIKNITKDVISINSIAIPVGQSYKKKLFEFIEMV